MRQRLEAPIPHRHCLHEIARYRGWPRPDRTWRGARSSLDEAKPPGLSRGFVRQALRAAAPRSRPWPSPVGDIADYAHRKGRINSQDLFGVNADLTLAGDDRPVDLVVIL